MKRLNLLLLSLLLSAGLIAGTYSGGSGTEAAPYEIATTADLIELSNTPGDWGAYFIQTADIDAAATSTLNSDGSGGYYGFSPIGNSTTGFAGSYDGNEKTISNLFINRPSTTGVGLFGHYDPYNPINNLGLINVDITGNENVGALIGDADLGAGASVSSCYSTGVISGNRYVGGLIGYAAISQISDSYSSCTVTGTQSEIGGLVGSVINEITGCYSTGNVSGDNNVGGLAGESYGNISNSYSTGSVTRNSGSTNTSFGGFCGSHIIYTIEYCYSTGDVIYDGATDPTDKGFVGYDGDGNYSDNFFDTGSNQSSATGATALTTAQMRDYNTFTDVTNTTVGLTSAWDFIGTVNDDAATVDIWDMDQVGTVNNGYPILSWQDGADDMIFSEITWNGTTDSDWNTTTNWDEEKVPDGTVDVIIPVVTTNYPTLSAAGAVNNILLGSSAAGTASLLDNGHLTVNGQATIQRYIIGGGYHNVSIPIVGGATAAAFTHSYLRRFDATATPQEWVSITDPETSLAADQGYMIWYTGANTTYEFAGNLITGAFTAATPSGASPNVDNQRYNLVPNPYPSAIDWDADPGWTKTHLNDAIYIWNREDDSDPLMPNGQYAAYAGGVSNPLDVLNGQIPVGQSFFVEAATTGSPELAMSNAVRVHGTQVFLKNETVLPNVLAAKTVSANGSDNTVIRLLDNATAAFDGQFDARKLYGSLALPQLYTLSSDNQMLSINALSVNDETTIVPLAVEWTQSGEITLSFSNLESFASSSAIFLEDLLTEEMMDVSEQPAYTFNYTEGDEPVRFRIHFMGVTSLDDLATAATHQIWSRNDNIYLSLPDHSGQTARIELFDLLGNKLMETSLKLENPSILRSPATGIVIVRITAGNEVFTNKLFIR